MTDTATPASTSARAPKRSRRKLFIIAAAVIVLLGGSAGAYFVYAMRSNTTPEAPAAAAEAPPGSIVSLEPFVVNLADQGASRFLRVSLSLVVENDAAVKEMAENAVVTARVRSAILELLAQQTSDAVITPEGKTALKKAIAERVAHADTKVKVTDVLFSEFVVQF